ncbi:hypothetical protein MtrunA17_Chr4g0024041 [Medicago truncatula]|uniref:Uncharacterized protein n=1 Tax=Medicago truncatula TaxID=3880 RepID=A0A396I3R1_MEDTR|nr:hypothetical protein MtrunA17_Chr4g0024041 [Medicago truncatula]
MLITSHANLSVSGHRRQAIVVVIGSIPSSKPPLISWKSQTAISCPVVEEDKVVS